MFKRLATLWKYARQVHAEQQEATRVEASGLHKEAAADLLRQGMAQEDAHHLAEAERCYRAGLVAAPEHAELHARLGALLYAHALGRGAEADLLRSEARSLLNRALALDAKLHLAHYHLGFIARVEGALDEALRCFENCLALAPGHEPAWVQWAYTQLDLGQAPVARARLAPVQAQFQTLELQAVWGMVLLRSGDEAAALALFEQLRSQAPDHPLVRLNLGLLYQQQGEYGAALEALERVGRNPSYPQGALLLGGLLLLLGHLKDGFALYERRFDLLSGEFARLREPLNLYGVSPRWAGEDLAGRRLLVWADQGLGDALMCLRFLPALRARGATLVLAVHPPLVRLCEHLGLAEQVIPLGERPALPWDFHCALLSVPHGVGLDLTCLPDIAVPYVSAPPAQVARWAARLAEYPGRKVGLVWAGNPDMGLDKRRSIPLTQWGAVLAVPGVSFVSLQKGAGMQALADAPVALLDWMDECQDMLDTAALICGLDLVIAVDTAVAHLAGALGKPVFLLNRHGSEWRWLLDRDDSPWYPSLRQFRQDDPTDWGPALARVAEALAAWALEPPRSLTRAEALKDEGNRYLQQSKPLEAERHYRAALALAPDYAPAHNNLARVLHACGRVPEARAHLRQALRAQPDLFQAHYNLGNWAREEGLLPEAETHLKACLALSPDYGPALLDLAYTLIDLGCAQEASLCLGERLRCAEQPELRLAWGRILQTLGDVDGARDVFLDLIARHPDHRLVRLHLGLLYQQCLQVDEAFKHLSLGLASDPEDLEMRLAMGDLLLMLGRWEEGWDLYENRLQLGRDKFKSLQIPLAYFGHRPRWDGEPLEGRRLLVWAEQGLGDSLMMLRFLPELKRLGAGRVLVALQAPLLALARAAGLADEVLPLAPLGGEHFDLHCSIMSLPSVLGLTLEDLPGRHWPYLQVPEAQAARWQARLATLPGRRVGIVWGGNPRLTKDALRSTALADWAPVLQVPGVSFVSLQKGAPAGQLAVLPYPVTDWMDECEDMLETAALISGLDLVISVDTSVAHLAGGLGKPVFLLNRHESEWRWLLGREDSPWYPGLRQFRQAAPGTWHETLARVAEALAALGEAAPVTGAEDLRRAGDALLAQGQYAEAEQRYRAGVRLAPQNAHLHCALGHVLYIQAYDHQGDAHFERLKGEAREHLRTALSLDGHSAEIFYTLGYWARAGAQQEEAVRYLEQALALAPDHAQALLELGYALTEARGPEAARMRFEGVPAVLQNPELKAVWAWILHGCGERERALPLYQDVLTQQPAHPWVLTNLALLHEQRAEWSAALALYRRLAQSAGSANGSLLLGMLLLRLGNYPEGLALYESRYAQQSPEGQTLRAGRNLVEGRALWQGEPLAGRSLLVWSEQGLGDTLMCVRFLPALRRLGVGRLVLAVQAPLVRLLRAAGLADGVVVKEAGVARDFDLHCALLSLPHLLKLRVADLPAVDMPYLEVPAVDQARWASRLAELPGRRVGLVWSGSPDMGKDRLRSIPLEAWAPVLQTPGVSFVSLQKGAAAQALRTLPLARGVVDWMDECQDMLDTAALICGLDLVIAVDTAVAHLAGALGKPVFLLNRHESEWRWLFAREDSPWYPSLRQFRQDAPGDWGPALARVAQALVAWELAPPLDMATAEALKDEGNRRFVAGDLTGAAQHYREALAHYPDYAPAWNNLGRVLYEQGAQEEAQEALKRALELAPGLAEAHYNLGHWARRDKDLARARRHLEACLAQAPGHPAALVDLAFVRLDQGDGAGALAQVEPWVGPEASAELLTLHAKLLLENGRPVEAEAAYLRTLAAHPACWQARMFLGELQLQQLRVPEALAYLAHPDLHAHPEARAVLGEALLLAGRWAEGFAHYEARLESGVYSNLRLPLACFGHRPRWQGEPLAGRRLVVWAEQGLGDSIMLARLLPALRTAGAGEVVLAVQPPLVRLMTEAGLADRVLPLAPLAGEAFDLQCSIVSLPALLGLSLEGLAAHVPPYLRVPEEAQARWTPRLAALPGLRVGLVWAGNPALRKDVLRSIPLEVWEPVLQIPGVSFVSLQKGEAAQALRTLPIARHVVDWMDECSDMLDTAALICGLDLVIAVDTSVLHLAAALGKPVFLLNRHESEWRWMLGREDSPWYPALRQFRQDSPGDWAPALARVATALEHLQGAEISVAQLLDQANRRFVAGALDEAEALYRQALTRAPEDATLHANLGQLLYSRAHGMREDPAFATWQAEALALLQRAVVLDPDLDAAWSNLGYWARAEGQSAQALMYLDKALALAPDNEAIWVQWAYALVDVEGAEAVRARLAPRAQAFRGRELKATWAWILQQCGEDSRALALYQAILEEAPGDDWARYLLGNLHLQRLEIEPALAALRMAARNPANIKARLALGHLLLLQGNLREGFALYEHRFDLVTGEYGDSYRLLRHFHGRPRWQGEPLAGRRLLVWAEQGLGDTLMALALLPRLRAQGAGHLIAVVQPALERLVRLSGLADEVLPLGAGVAPEAYDLHCPLLSLPHALGLTLGALQEGAAPYLQVPEVLIQPWRARLANLPGRRVGLVWAGNPKLHRDALRSIPLARWAEVLAVPGVSFVSLQKGSGVSQLAEAHYPVTDWMASCEDMLDTAALISGLDLVIAVDTSVAHLAAALGKPVFLLNRHESEWRWMLEREDCPWYPSLRQFRQDNPADWGPTLARVAQALADGVGRVQADALAAEQLKDQGNQCLAQGNREGAEAAYRAALRQAPDHPASLNNLGRVLRDTGRPEEARACLVHALEVKPDLFQAHYNLGCWARLEGDAVGARTHLEACLHLQPGYEAALLELACVLADLGALGEARALLAPRLGPGASADVLALDTQLAQAQGRAGA